MQEGNMLLCSKAHPATITHEFKDSDVYRPCPADSVYYAIALVSSLTVKIPFSCPITLMAQNSKTIRIIFLPKCTQKNCAFYAAFYMFFLRISVLSGKTKSALAMIFSGYFHINRPRWVSPLFNSAKIRTKGVIGLTFNICSDYYSPSLSRQTHE